MRLKALLLKIVASLLCVVMAAALIALFFMNRTRNAERSQALKKQAEELERQAELKKEEAADIYDALAATLLVRNIICWGDSEMAGDGEFSLPQSLKEVANEKLFRDTTREFSNAMDREAEPALSVTVSNMGVRNEGMREILVRAGVNELQVGQWTVIPSDTDPHNIELKDNVSWSMLRFAKQSEAKFGKVNISGVTGTLTVGDGEYDEDHPKFAFVRDEEGDSAACGAGTPVEIASATDYIGDIPVFFFEDDSADSVSEFVKDLQDLVQRYTEYGEDDDESDEAGDDAEEEGEQTENADEAGTDIEAEWARIKEEQEAETGPSANGAYVVICTAEEDSNLDEALRDAFGMHYIRSDTYAYEMTEESYRKLAEKVYDKLDSQGCFDYARKQMDKAVKQLDEL